jgi:proteasome lid subunit RPN8/RPN11
MAEVLTISAEIRDEIIDHARAGKPEEICGLLRGRHNRAFELIRARNIADDKIENYDVDPQTLRLQFEFEDAGDQMVAIYHSHPVSVAYPSATDAWSAHYPDTYYVICSLEYDERPVLRAFRLIAHWLDLEIERLQQSLPFCETRPGLFGFYQADNKALPQTLRTVATEVPPPFYIVFSVDEARAVDDYRIVSVREHPVEIV